MTITLTWHLILMIVVSIILLIRALSDDVGLDFSLFFYGIIVVIIWSVYGGIFWW